MHTSSIIVLAFAVICFAQTHPKGSTIDSESITLPPNEASIYPGAEHCTTYYFLPSLYSYLLSAASEWAALSTALAIPVLGYLGFPQLAIFAAPVFAQAQIGEAIAKQYGTAPGSCHNPGGSNLTVGGNLPATPAQLHELCLQDKKSRAGSGGNTGRTSGLTRPRVPGAASGTTSFLDLRTLTIGLAAALIGSANIPTLLLLSATTLIALPSLASAQLSPKSAARPSVTHVVDYDIFGRPFTTVFDPHTTDIFLPWHPPTRTSETTVSSTTDGVLLPSGGPVSSDAAGSMSMELALVAIFGVLGWIVVDLVWEWMVGVGGVAERGKYDGE